MSKLADRIWYGLLRRPYRLVVREEGQGEPVVLLHGIAAKGAHWKPLLKRLSSDTWRVIIPDLLGFGDSPTPQGARYDVAQHARAVLASLRWQAGLTGPFTLVGHSMGCLVATHIAATNPDLVKRLVLYEPPLFADAPEDFPRHTKLKDRYFAFFGFLATHPELAATEGHLLWRAAKRLTGFGLTEERWTAFERSLRHTIMDQGAYNELHAITIPTDIIYGRLDFVVIRADVKKMFRANRNIKLHLVTQTHGITAHSAGYIANLLAGKQPKNATSK